jgi:hypothetical protein
MNLKYLNLLKTDLNNNKHGSWLLPQGKICKPPPKGEVFYISIVE